LETKRLPDDSVVTMRINGNNIQYTTTSQSSMLPVSISLSSGYSASSTAVPNCESAEGLVSFNDGAISRNITGISNIYEVNSPENNQGYFVACDKRNYCSAVVKVNTKNSFVACIRRGVNANWEAL